MFLSSLFQQGRKGVDQEARGKPVEVGALTLFEDILERGLSLRVRVTGESMKPFLRGGEIVTIKKEAPHGLRKGDLIFFKNGHGPPLLHRLIQRRESPDGKFTFLTKGDALIALDKPVPYHRILGKVRRIEKTNLVPRLKYINMESGKWRAINSIAARISLLKSYLYRAWRMAQTAWSD